MLSACYFASNTALSCGHNSSQEQLVNEKRMLTDDGSDEWVIKETFLRNRSIVEDGCKKRCKDLNNKGEL